RLADSQGRPRQGLEYALHAYTSIGSLTASARSEMLFCAALANVSLGDRSGALSEASMAIKDTPRDPALRDFTAGLLLQGGRTAPAPRSPNVAERSTRHDGARGQPIVPGSEPRHLDRCGTAAVR